MTSASSILADLRRKGVELAACDGTLHYKGRRAILTPEILATLAKYKPALLAALEEENKPSYTLVQHPDQLIMVCQAIDESAVVYVDTETTGLNPRQHRVRLLSLATDRGTFLIDCFVVSPQSLWERLAEKTLVGHNLAFDLAFLAPMGFTPGVVKDTMLLSQLVFAGKKEKHTLAACAERELGKRLAKELQTADWSRELTPEKLQYAALDVDILPPLLRALGRKISAGRLEKVAELEHGCLLALVWLSQSGMPFSVESWLKLAEEAKQEADRLASELDSTAPTPPQRSLFGGGWNWDSPAQVLQAFQAAGITLEKTDDDTLAKLDHPMAMLLRKYREARKRCTTYGRDWLKNVAENGRVYANWKQVGAAATGRMSCKQPNLQQIPRGEYRHCFRAPPGRVLVKADYSQIELRIAAKVSADASMLEAYQDGQDLHTLTAKLILGKDEVGREDRQIAKSANFGLLYGMGAKGFQRYAKSNFGVEISLEDAHRYREAFFSAYPGLRSWYRRVSQARASETRTLAGRRRLLDADAFDTLRLNSPVQGTGADGLKLALALLWERRDQVSGAFPVLVAHDEIVAECEASQAEQVASWVRQAMMDGMAPLIAPVPVEVEIKIAETWAG
jgi:DNA polymerase-1